jgi:CheY-like chemotaxis protein
MADVLVVDDDTVSRMLLTHMLGRLGHRVEEADGVGAAAEQALADHFDLVLCDYQMLDGVGLDLLEVLSGRGDRPRFVLVTTTADQEDVGDDRVGAVDAFLTKPVSSHDLAACVAALLAPGPLPA